MVILISGQQGSGKSTLAKRLNERLSNSKLMKFADIIYEMHDAIKKIAHKYDIPFEEKEGSLLQYLGTDFFRSKNQDVWANALLKRVEPYINNTNDIVIIDDTRFKNEFDMFIGYENVIKVRLECDEQTRKSRAEGWRDNTTHISEIDLNDYVKDGKFDLVINTNTYNSNQVLLMVLDQIVYLKRKTLTSDTVVI